QADVLTAAINLDGVDAGQAEDVRREGIGSGDPETVIVVARDQRSLEQVVAESLCRSGLSAEAKGREGSDRYKFAHCWNLHSFFAHRLSVRADDSRCCANQPIVAFSLHLVGLRYVLKGFFMPAVRPACGRSRREKRLLRSAGCAEPGGN